MASRSPHSSNLYRTVVSSIGKQPSHPGPSSSSSSSSTSTSSLPRRSFTSTPPTSSTPPPSLVGRSEAFSPSFGSLPPPSPPSSSSAYGTPPPPPPASSSSPFGSSPFSSHISRAPRAPPPLRLAPRKPKLKPLSSSSLTASSSKPPQLFEDESEEYLDAERSLPIASLISTSASKKGGQESTEDVATWRDPRTLPCSTLAAAVRQKDWEESRRQLLLLHERGAGALESQIYVSAAVESLTSMELETDAERLEWFIHWYSLVPPFAGEERAYLTSLFAQENARLCEVLLRFETHLEHLTRILVLFGEKRYAAFFAPRLLPHIVRFGPPERAMDVLEAVALASGWSTSNVDRNELAVKVIKTLVQSGHFHEAVEGVARVRRIYDSIQETRDGRRSTRPPIPGSLYQTLLLAIFFHWGKQHTYYRALVQWRSEDYPGWSFDERPRVEFRRPVRRMEAPTPAQLPKAIRELFLPQTIPNAKTLSFVLHSIYLLQPPRYSLIGLIHRRISGITQISETVRGDETIWIRAEMLRLIRGQNEEEALRLYASRYLWIGLPTGPRWDEWKRLHTSTQEDVGLGEDVVGGALTGIRRKQVPPAGMVSLALSAISTMNQQEQELLEEDYVSFLENCTTRDPARSSSTQDSTPRLSIPGLSPSTLNLSDSAESLQTVDISDPSSSTEPTSLAQIRPNLSLSSSPPSSPPVPITPWAAPPTPFYLPPPLLPTRSNFHVWIRAFSFKHPAQAMGILKDMVDRKIHTDTFDWSLVLEGFVRNNHPELAISGLQTLEKEGGILLSMEGVRILDNRSLLGPIEPLADGEVERPLPPLISSPSSSDDPNSTISSEDAKPEIPRIQISRPRLKVIPPANTEVYVRLIRAADHVNELEISKLFEEMMLNAKVVLSDWHKHLMQRVYHHRGVALNRERRATGRPELEEWEWEVSPWGEPEGDEYVSGPDGRSLPHLRWAEKGWARTEEDDGEPIESRLKRMMPSEGQRDWNRRMERKVMEEEVERMVEKKRWKGERRSKKASVETKRVEEV